MSLASSYFLASITSLLFYPSRIVIIGINTLDSVKIALKRMDRFLSLEETNTRIQTEGAALGTLSLRNLTASWVN